MEEESGSSGGAGYGMRRGGVSLFGLEYVFNGKIVRTGAGFVLVYGVVDYAGVVGRAALGARKRKSPGFYQKTGCVHQKIMKMLNGY